MPNAPRIFTNLRRNTSEREERYYQLTAVKWRTLPKVSHKSPAADPLFGTYNSLLNPRYNNHTKTVAFADDLVIMI
jgi:hypothetical protein